MDHRRGDGELLGRMIEQGDGWVAVDLLGRPVTDAVDLHGAATALDALGLAYLAEPYELTLPDGSVERVRIVEVRPDAVRVKRDDYGAIDAPQTIWDLPNPTPDSLRRR